MPTFFVTAESIAPPTIRITGQLLHHLRDSLRLRLGDELTLIDESGTRYHTEVAQVTTKALEARILGQTTAPPRIAPTLILAQAILKGEKMDWVIQKATELGVDHIVPIHAKHGVVKIQPDRLDHQRARWERIALEAAQQSERWTLSTIEAPTDLSHLFREQAYATTKIILSERSRDQSLTKVPLTTNTGQAILMLIGPEGGWDVEELRLAGEAGFQAVTIGQRILRAETAAIAAVSILQSRLGELG
jgi:16S rRNA (uracil1498-N3)-methyltransferase